MPYDSGIRDRDSFNDMMIERDSWPDIRAIYMDLQMEFRSIIPHEPMHEPSVVASRSCRTRDMSTDLANI